MVNILCHVYVMYATTWYTKYNVCLTYFYIICLVQFLAELYIHGEKTYVIEKGERMTDVTVKRFPYKLTPEAMKAFEDIYDEWELNICKKYPHDSLIGG